MKYFSVILFLILNISAFAQGYICKIFHTNGAVYYLNIVKISDLGLIDSTNKYISYKSIDSLITSSELLIDDLRKMNRISYSKNSIEDYVIIFDRTIYKSIKPARTVYDINPTIFLNSVGYNFLTFGLEYKLSIAQSLLQRFIAGGGTTFGTPNHNSVNFGYGMGIDILKSDFNIQVWMNCTGSILYSFYDNEKYSKEEMLQYFINGVTYFPLNNSKSLYLGIGLTYHLNQFNINDATIPFSIQSGLKFTIENR